MSDSNIIIPLTREHVLISEKNAVVKSMTKVEIDISVLERVDPDLVVAQKRITPNSVKEITAKEMLEDKRQEYDDFKKRFDIIEMLLEAKK